MHAVNGGKRLYTSQPGDLSRIGGDQQLAAAPMRNAVRFTVAVELLSPRHAEPRFQRAGGVVDAGMNHLAVARASARADGAGAFQNHCFQAPLTKRTTDGQADHSGADHHCVDFVHLVPEMRNGDHWGAVVVKVTTLEAATATS